MIIFFKKKTKTHTHTHNHIERDLEALYMELHLSLYIYIYIYVSCVRKRINPIHTNKIYEKLRKQSNAEISRLINFVGILLFLHWL